ncbi:MAG: yccA [Gammaproteobacteria bacterium]|jgi:modulator of FtsH protease|nr:yccA [Gammaproteobacteria bacterium]
MNNNSNVIVRGSASTLATNSVLRNTYFLLSLTLLFSAVTAAFSMAIGANPGIIVLLVGMFGLSFLVNALRNSAWGIVAAFAFTGFMGYMLGPILNAYLSGYTNGGQLVMTALGGTGFVFLALSGYALTTKKDFSYLGGFLFAGIMVAFLASLAGIFFQMPLFQLVISGAFALLSSGLILYHTSNIIHGGETNYIMATISIYTALFNLFVSLLNILGAFAGNRD